MKKDALVNNASRFKSIYLASHQIFGLKLELYACLISNYIR
jgi:hypothetical protein